MRQDEKDAQRVMRQQADIPGAVNAPVRHARGPRPVGFDLVDVTRGD
jgi:hypothetical protein